jgi:hypothetical protein
MELVGELLEDAWDPLCSPLEDPVTLIEAVPVLCPDAVPRLGVRHAVAVGQIVGLPEELRVPTRLALPAPLEDPVGLTNPVALAPPVGLTILPEGELVTLWPVELPAALGVCPLALARPLGLLIGVGLTDPPREAETVAAGVPVRDCVEDPDALADPDRLKALVPLPQRVTSPLGVPVAIPVELTEGLVDPWELPELRGVPVKD